MIMNEENMREEKQAPIIDIARHRLTIDGEGVTTLVAFHGCPLRCKYCLNPSSLREDGERRLYTPEELYEEVRVDELYFLATEGGVTFGGGEPMLRSDFIARFRQLCGPRWRITLETSLNVDHRHIETLLPIVNNYIVDIKDTDERIYRMYTDKDNQRAMDNLRYLIAQGKAESIVVRTPLIPYFNTEQNVAASAERLKEMGVKYLNRFTYRTPNIENL